MSDLKRLPDGYIFRMKCKSDDHVTIDVEIEKSELVICKHCRYSEISKDDESKVRYCLFTGSAVPAEGFCYLGGREDK